LPFSIGKKVGFTYQKTVIFHGQALVLRSPPRRPGSACDARAPQVRSMAGSWGFLLGKSGAFMVISWEF